jgi:hypothetical protein
MTMVGDDAYGIFATPTTARAFRLGAGAATFETEVDTLRDSITKVENGQIVTYPFDVELSHKLFEQLFASVKGELPAVRHLIFEPDGALLRLPPNLLVSERAGVDAYLAKAKRPNDEGFDFTDVQWLGRDRDVSTAVSARSFRDVRQVGARARPPIISASARTRFPAGTVQTASAVRGLLDEGTGCSWSIAEWTRPISSEELRTASNILGRQRQRYRDRHRNSVSRTRTSSSARICRSTGSCTSRRTGW